LHLAEGQQVALKGRLQTRWWDDADGNSIFDTKAIEAIFRAGKSGHQASGRSAAPGSSHRA